MVTTYMMITVLGGLLIYLLRPQWFILYAFTIDPIIFPLFTNLEGIIDPDLFNELQLLTDRIMIYLFTFLILYEYFINNKRTQSVHKIIFPCGLLFSFLIIQNVLIHFNWATLYEAIRYVILLPLVVILMFLNKKTIPSYKDCFVLLLIIVGLQAIWAVFELNGIYPYLIFYTGYGATFSEGLVSGTFGRFNGMTNFLTTVYLCFSFDYFLNKRISPKVFFLLSFIILLLILVSGAKMSIVLFAFIWAVNVIYNWKQNVLTGISSVLILLIILFSIDFLSSTYPGIERAMLGFKSIFEGGEDHNTSSLSVYLYDNYFHRSPLFGNGLSWRGEYAYDSNISLIIFKADARLMYTLVEYGIIGTMFYFIYFFKLLRMPVRIKSRQIHFFTLFSLFYFCIMTFTEGGLFDFCNVIMVLVYISMFQLDIINKSLSNVSQVGKNNNERI